MKGSQRIVPRILVPTDFSTASERAFFCALALAVARQARLTMLHTGREGRDAIPWNQFPGIRETLTQWQRLPADAPRTAVAETVCHVTRTHSLMLPKRGPDLMAEGA